MAHWGTIREATNVRIDEIEDVGGGKVNDLNQGHFIITFTSYQTIPHQFLRHLFQLFHGYSHDELKWYAYRIVGEDDVQNTIHYSDGRVRHIRRLVDGSWDHGWDARDTHRIYVDDGEEHRFYADDDSEEDDEIVNWLCDYCDRGFTTQVGAMVHERSCQERGSLVEVEEEVEVEDDDNEEDDNEEEDDSRSRQRKPLIPRELLISELISCIKDSGPAGKAVVEKEVIDAVTAKSALHVLVAAAMDYVRAVPLGLSQSLPAADALLITSIPESAAPSEKPHLASQEMIDSVVQALKAFESAESSSSSSSSSSTSTLPDSETQLRGTLSLFARGQHTTIVPPPQYVVAKNMLVGNEKKTPEGKGSLLHFCIYAVNVPCAQLLLALGASVYSEGSIAGRSKNGGDNLVGLLEGTALEMTKRMPDTFTSKGTTKKLMFRVTQAGILKSLLRDAEADAVAKGMSDSSAFEPFPLAPLPPRAAAIAVAAVPQAPLPPPGPFSPLSPEYLAVQSSVVRLFIERRKDVVRIAADVLPFVAATLTNTQFAEDSKDSKWVETGLKALEEANKVFISGDELHIIMELPAQPPSIPIRTIKPIEGIY